MKIDYELACQDGCLDVILPSDLRHLVCERDQAYRNIDILKAEMESLRDQYRWRDVREELPRENLPVLVSYKSIFMSEVQSVAILFDGVEWRQLIGGSKFSDAKVTHWMPLPTPPTSQSNKD